MQDIKTYNTFIKIEPVNKGCSLWVGVYGEQVIKKMSNIVRLPDHVVRFTHGYPMLVLSLSRNLVVMTAIL